MFLVSVAPSFTTVIGSTSPQKMRRTPERGDTRRHDNGYLVQDNVKKKRKKENGSVSLHFFTEIQKVK